MNGLMKEFDTVLELHKDSPRMLPYWANFKASGVSERSVITGTKITPSNHDVSNIYYEHKSSILRKG